MYKLLKKYCVELCLLLIVVIVLLRTSRILERFQEDVSRNASEEERLRDLEIVGALNMNI